MNNENTISVVIPTCNNRPQFFAKTLVCVRKQTRTPLEIIVVNNGPDKLDASDGVKIFNIVHYAGPAQARNLGASVAQGEYVAFIDDDDLWEDEYLEKGVGVMADTKADCLVTRLDALKNETVSVYKNAEGQIDLKILLLRNPGITGSSTIVKRQTFMEIGGYDGKLPPSEDKSLVIDLLLKNKKIITASNIQSIIRQHDHSSRLSDPATMAEGIFQFIHKYKKYMNIHHLLWNRQKMYWYRSKMKRSLGAYIGYVFIKLIRQPLRPFENL